MNAKDELLNRLKNVPYKVKCAKIQRVYVKDLKAAQQGYVVGSPVPCASETISCLLKCKYTDRGWIKFLDSLDFNYDNGFGLQEMQGTVWFENGTWLSRVEYDGAEWWEFNEHPDIPEELN